MAEVTIDAMNEAIAQFMGGVKQIIPKGGLHGYKEGTALWMYLFSGNADPVRSLEYNTSWDWIVPVYKKIKGMHLDILKQSFVMAYMHAAGPMNSAWSFVDIEKLHKGIYQFIIWYNDNQQQQNNG